MATAREPGVGHNNPPVNGDLDKRIIDAFKVLDGIDDEKKELAEQTKDTFAMLKALGYDTVTLRALRKDWKMDREALRAKLDREDAYRRALGLDLV